MSLPKNGPAQANADRKTVIAAGDPHLNGKELTEFIKAAHWPKKSSKFKATALLIAARFPAAAALVSALQVLLDENEPPPDVKASCVCAYSHTPVTGVKPR